MDLELPETDHGVLYEVREKLWNGSINVTVRLAVGDGEVREFLASIHRNSYFALHFESIVNYFKLFVPSIYTNPVWLEYDGKLIKWNIPIGVLYDELCLRSQLLTRDRDTTITATTESMNSWVLLLKWDKYPSNELIPFVYKHSDQSIDYKRMLQEVVVNQLKQSCYVLNSSSKPIMSLSESDSSQLWYGIETHNWMTFNTINSKIIPTYDVSRVPVRICNTGTSITNVIQSPILPTHDGSPTTLKEVLDDNVPQIMASIKNAKASAYIHGIDVTPLLDESILMTWNIFRHLDNFLYITIINLD